MLHPSRLGIDLFEFFLSNGYDIPSAVEEDGAGTRGSLVQGHDEFCFHAKLFWLFV